MLGMLVKFMYDVHVNINDSKHDPKINISNIDFRYPGEMQDKFARIYELVKSLENSKYLIVLKPKIVGGNIYKESGRVELTK